MEGEVCIFLDDIVTDEFKYFVECFSKMKNQYMSELSVIQCISQIKMARKLDFMGLIPDDKKELLKNDFNDETG